MGWFEILRGISRHLARIGRRTIVLTVRYCVTHLTDPHSRDQAPARPTTHVVWSNTSTRSRAWDDLWTLLIDLVVESSSVPEGGDR